MRIASQHRWARRDLAQRQAANSVVKAGRETPMTDSARAAVARGTPFAHALSIHRADACAGGAVVVARSPIPPAARPSCRVRSAQRSPEHVDRLWPSGAVGDDR